MCSLGQLDFGATASFQVYQSPFTPLCAIVGVSGQNSLSGIHGEYTANSSFCRAQAGFIEYQRAREKSKFHGFLCKSRFSGSFSLQYDHVKPLFFNVLRYFPGDVTLQITLFSLQAPIEVSDHCQDSGSAHFSATLSASC